MNRFIKRTGIGVVIILILWACINPYIFTFQQNDEDAIKAFGAKELSFSLEDYYYKNNKLHIARIGDSSKPVLLFIHGSPGSWNTAWDYFMDSSWQKHYELISLDRPGFGMSDYGQAKNLFEQAQIINAFVKERLKNRRVQLIGHSYGGPLVLQLCADQDSLYDRCIIMAGSVNPDAEESEWQLNVFSHPILKWMVPGSFEQGMEELLWLKDDLKSYVKGLSNIRTPIVGIYGTKDNMVPYVPNVHFLNDNFDTTQLKIYPIQDGSHFIPWENYEDMKRIIEDVQ